MISGTMLCPSQRELLFLNYEVIRNPLSPAISGRTLAHPFVIANKILLRRSIMYSYTSILLNCFAPSNVRLKLASVEEQTAHLPCNILHQLILLIAHLDQIRSEAIQKVLYFKFSYCNHPLVRRIDSLLQYKPHPFASMRITLNTNYPEQLQSLIQINLSYWVLSAFLTPSKQFRIFEQSNIRQTSRQVQFLDLTSLSCQPTQTNQAIPSQSSVAFQDLLFPKYKIYFCFQNRSTVILSEILPPLEQSAYVYLKFLYCNTGYPRLHSEAQCILSPYLIVTQKAKPIVKIVIPTASIYRLRISLPF
eukprot:TRINITY_DN18978_c0_g1_i1.p2 TRINITY_DN18978_c0_g1~~TRINITY_DN18978_c0_g1_i1.p2  ORF type:complete len:305 (+),score=-39.98 TRINITY_DN18978_c0_g1_i1:1077-1991(+)